MQEYIKHEMCQFNTGCACDVSYKDGEPVRQCDKCGFNPVIAKERKRKLNALQFLRDANTPTNCNIITGAIVIGADAKPVTMKISRSPQGNFVVRLPDKTLVIPGKQVKETINGR